MIEALLREKTTAFAAKPDIVTAQAALDGIVAALHDYVSFLSGAITPDGSRRLAGALDVDGDIRFGAIQITHLLRIDLVNGCASDAVESTLGAKNPTCSAHQAATLLKMRADMHQRTIAFGAALGHLIPQLEIETIWRRGNDTGVKQGIMMRANVSGLALSLREAKASTKSPTMATTKTQATARDSVGTEQTRSPSASEIGALLSALAQSARRRDLAQAPDWRRYGLLRTSTLSGEQFSRIRCADDDEARIFRTHLISRHRKVPGSPALEVEIWGHAPVPGETSSGQPSASQPSS